ncbi:DUF4446 family protein [Nocardioidaceae bacterium]|nr:DUF4446 family protein [Nocardioidaceae bacterium]
MAEVLVVVLALVGAVTGVIALFVALTAARRGRGWRAGESEGIDLEGMRLELAHVKADVAESLRQLAVVRYDAFGDTGGALSWSLALLDDRGDGVVLTSIHGRQEVRSYAKSVTAWASEQPLSPEETEAIGLARQE